MTNNLHPLLSRTRRQFFKDWPVALGTAARASMLTREGLAMGPAPRTDALAPHPPHYPAKAKSVIYLFMNGAPSQLDLFDPKPKLVELDRKDCPEGCLKGERFPFIRGTPKLLASPHKFVRSGKCGAEISELLPHTQSIADDIAIVRSMKTDHFNHAPAELFINTGLGRIGRPSMGSWITYGLGSEAADLPGFVVMLSGGGQPSGGCSCWSSGFLPTVYQGVQFRSGADPVLFVRTPEGIDARTRRRSLDAIGDLNRIRLDSVGDPEIA